MSSCVDRPAAEKSAIRPRADAGRDRFRLVAPVKEKDRAARFDRRVS